MQVKDIKALLKEWDEIAMMEGWDPCDGGKLERNIRQWLKRRFEEVYHQGELNNNKKWVEKIEGIIGGNEPTWCAAEKIPLIPQEMLNLEKMVEKYLGQVIRNELRNKQRQTLSALKDSLCK